MRILTCLLLAVFFFVCNCFSQDSTGSVVRINSLTPEGIVLNKGWKFIAGDNPAYASTDYNDNEWKSVDPTKDIHDIPALWKNNIVWFRLKLEISNGVRQQPLSMTIDQ